MLHGKTSSVKFQPLFKMENQPTVYASTSDDSLMKPPDQREHSGSPHDIMTRRLKNRERQRRYRARKRLEADMKKACTVDQSTPLQVEIQVNGVVNVCVTRIHCLRDWKKDARNAHVFKKQEVKSNGSVIPEATAASGSQLPFYPPGVHAQPLLERDVHCRSSILDDSETQRSAPSRRHWKAEARNKKN